MKEEQLIDCECDCPIKALPNFSELGSDLLH